jgi:hypothetical protein
MKVTLKRIHSKYIVTVNGTIYPFNTFMEALIFVFEL